MVLRKMFAIRLYNYNLISQYNLIASYNLFAQITVVCAQNLLSISRKWRECIKVACYNPSDPHGVVWSLDLRCQFEIRILCLLFFFSFLFPQENGFIVVIWAAPKAIAIHTCVSCCRCKNFSDFEKMHLSNFCWIFTSKNRRNFLFSIEFLEEAELTLSCA